ncbi:hypothetical protein ILYODFUR_019609 [Ilyodon furcidens]|uniref:Uncharacterized protein n=1 Tax=Ilyodon furcidens TaxID=33524 RepID=A0ABV0UAL7_9TELE
MSDFESDDFESPQGLLPGPCPPPPVSPRRSTRLDSSRVHPSPSSQLRASGISPCSDLDTSQLAQLVELLPHGSPSVPPPPFTSSGKRLRKTSNTLAKHRRGRPASSPAPAASLPGPSSMSVAPLLEPPVHQASSSTPGIPASFIASMDSLQRSITSLTQHFPDFSAIPATSALPLPPAQPDTQSPSRALLGVFSICIFSPLMLLTHTPFFNLFLFVFFLLFPLHPSLCI